MGWSIKIGRVAGIDLKIHLTFFVLLAWIGISYYMAGGSEAAVEGLVFILLLFGCVLLHELGHAMMARVYGIATPDITLLPIGGVARLQRIPENPRQEIMIALAGPAVNVVIALILIAMLGQVEDPSEILVLDDPKIGLIAKLAVVNVWLVLFNLLPAFPMDGGRVLRAVLAMFMPYTQATQSAARIGQGMAFFFGLLGLFGNPILLFIALFVYLAATQEAMAAQMRDVARGLLTSDAMMTRFESLPAGTTLSEALEALLRTGQREFPIVTGEGRLLGVLTRDDLAAGHRERGPDSRVEESMHKDVPTIPQTAPLEKALAAMQECACPALAVVDRSGRMVGMVTPENVGELMLMHSVLKRGESPAWRRSDD